MSLPKRVPWKRLATLRIAGKTIHARFLAGAAPPLPASAREVSRVRYPRSQVRSVYWNLGSRGGYRLSFSDAGTFDLDARRGRVRCHLAPRASPTSVEEVLRGPVCSFFLIEQGFEPLHAGAVLLARRVVAFAGAPGAGKSSLIACLVQGGARFFADDVIPLRVVRQRVRAWPGLPQLRLVPRSLHALGWQGRTLWSTRWKATLAARPARGPAPIDCIYLLDRKNTCVRPFVQTLPPREAFLALVSHTRNIAETGAARMQTQMRVCGWLANHVPVRRFIYRTGFAHLEAARRAILNAVDW